MVPAQVIEKQVCGNKGLEISLEKEKGKNGKILGLKFKACIKLKDEIKVMDMFKKTLIDGYGGKRLA